MSKNGQSSIKKHYPVFKIFTSFSANETVETLENATLKWDSQCRRDFTKHTKLSIRSQ